MGKKNLSDGGTSNDIAADKGKNKKWTKQMDNILIGALSHQHDISNRVDGAFTTTAYDNVLKELCEKLGGEFNKQQLKNRLKTIKKNFNECYDIFKGGVSGFSWSPLTNMWDAEPEVWNLLVKSKPKAKKWMNTPIYNYDTLSKLYGNDRAIGLSANNANENARRCATESEHYEDDGEGGNTSDDIDQMVAQDFIMLQSDNHEQICPTTPHEATSEAPDKSTNSSNSKKRKSIQSLDDENLNVAVKKIAVAMKETNEILKETNEILKRSFERSQHVYKEEEVYDELMRLGVDREVRIKGYSFLIENPMRVRAFFGCRVEDRVQFLVFQMRRAGSYLRSSK